MTEDDQSSENKTVDRDGVILLDAFLYSVMIFCTHAVIRLLTYGFFHVEEFQFAPVYIIFSSFILAAVSCINKKKYKGRMIFYSLLLLLIMSLFAPAVVYT